MDIGKRLRSLRERINLSQGHIEKRTGLLRGYISRVGNGYTVPSVITLEKFARALEVPMYRLFYDGQKLRADLHIPKTEREELWGDKGTDAKTLVKFRRALAKISNRDRKLLLKTAKSMTKS